MKIIAAAAVVVLLLFASGCPTTPDEAYHPETPSAVAPAAPSAEELHRKKLEEKRKLFARAERSLKEARKLFDRHKFERAKDAAERGIRALMAIDQSLLAPHEIQKFDDMLYALLTCWQGSHEAIAAPKYERIRPSDVLEWELTPEVEKAISSYLGPRRGELTRAVWRAGLYMDRVRKILEEEGVPEDLAYLPIIESGYSPFAVSAAGAVGLWQFIPSTARRYGLKIDRWIDERRDIEKSTRAACRYLKDLKETYGSWQLALAAYNCGEGRLNQALRKVDGSNFDYSDLALPHETRRYVPQFYAVLAILKYPDVFGFQPLYASEMEWAELKLARPADIEKLSKLLGIEYQQLKLLNPELLGKYTPLSGPYKLKVPKEQFEEIKAKFAPLDPNVIYLSDKKIEEIKRGKRRIVYRVKRGDSLYRIARKFGVTVAALKKWNPRTARKKYLQPGDRLVIYTSAKYSSRYSSPRRIYYTVRKGDSLYSIARKFGVTVADLKRWNPELKRSKYIYPGMRLVVKRR